MPLCHPIVPLPLDLVPDFGNWNQTEDKPAVWQEVLWLVVLLELVSSHPTVTRLFYLDVVFDKMYRAADKLIQDARLALW